MYRAVSCGMRIAVVMHAGAQCAPRDDRPADAQDPCQRTAPDPGSGDEPAPISRWTGQPHAGQALDRRAVRLNPEQAEQGDRHGRGSSVTAARVRRFAHTRDGSWKDTCSYLARAFLSTSAKSDLVQTAKRSEGL